MIARSASVKRSRGAGTAFIIAFSAVGNRKVCVTRWRCHQLERELGREAALQATISRPK